MAKDKSTKETKMKFGIKDAAEHMDTNPQSLRSRLRNAGVEKTGKSYGWPSKSAMVDDLKSLGEKKAKAPSKKEKKSKKSKKD